jgi:nucleoside 2-deoxyribosyltransferase
MQSENTGEIAGSCSVVGGVYREITRFPLNDEVMGSGGRAAAVIASLGIHTTLHTAVDSRTSAYLVSLSHLLKFGVQTISVPSSIQFLYNHGLSTPEISPSIAELDLAKFKVTAENALVFGMLEAAPKVLARRVVYDPQNPIAPEPFQSRPGADIPSIAYVLNATEARKMGRSADLVECAKTIAGAYGLESVVIKQGARGALVYEAGKIEIVPVYQTPSVWPIGSGDIFAATFAAFWAVRGVSAVDAAHHASRAAAVYVNSHVLPLPMDSFSSQETFPFPALSVPNEALPSNAYHVYLAGPFFNIGQSWLIEESRQALQAMGLKVFSPCHDVGLGLAQDVAPKDIDAIHHSRAIFALVDGLDSGTIFEIGYARALGIPVIALAQSTTEESLKMIEGTGCEVVSDFVTAIYRTSWAAYHE